MGTAPVHGRARRATAMLVVSLLATVPVLASTTPATAATPVWTPPPTAVPASPTYLMVSSQAASPFPDGSILTTTSADADVTVSESGGELTMVSNGTDRYALRIGVPAGASTFTAGATYEGLTRFRGATGSIDLEDGSTGCNVTSGRMHVDVANYVGGVLQQIRLQFTQVCDHQTAFPLYGQLAWDATAVVPAPPGYTPTVPTGLWSPPGGSTPATGNFSYVEARPGSKINGTDHLLATGDAVTMQQALAQPDDESGEPLAAWLTVTAGATAVGLHAPPRFDAFDAGYYSGFEDANAAAAHLTAVTGSGCAASTSWLAIDELTLSDRYVTHIEFRYATGCVRGEVSWTAHPSITTVSPASGPRRGGTQISITGRDLFGVTAVTVGGQPAPLVDGGPTNLFATVPALPLGPATVVVSGAGGPAAGTGSTGFTATPNPPGLPGAVTATPAPGAVAVSWSAPGDIGDSAITGVDVSIALASDPTGPPVATQALDPTATHADFPRIPINGPKVATVTYVNAAGAGSVRQSASFVVPADLTPFPSVGAMVTQQYVDFIGRQPTANEKAAGSSQITVNLTEPSAWAASMRNQPEWGGVRTPVIRLYQSYFLRLPDSGGLTHWANKLRDGTSLTSVSAAFAASTEFVRRYGSLTNGAFVDLVYQNVLGRKADADGRTHWIRKLNDGASRGSVMVAFSESSEHIRKSQPTVDAVLLYTGMLRRMPTSTELATALASTPEDLAYLLMHSPAYDARV